MGPQNMQILSLIAVGIGMLLWILSLQLFNLNRKKGLASIILAFLYTIFAVYYLYLVLSVNASTSIVEKDIIKLPETEVHEKSEKNEFFIVLHTDTDSFELADGDEIEIKKNMRFKIERVKTVPESKDVKVDFKGFAGNQRYNDRQDIGYWITYDNVLKHWKVDKKKEKYEIQVLKGEEVLGSIYIIFVD